MAPPIANAPWSKESGMFGGSSSTAAPLFTGATQLAIDPGHCAPVPNVDGCAPPGRPRIRPSPRTTLVPDFVTMLTAGPEVQPNSAENAFDMTFISSTAPTGNVANIVCRPQGSLPVAPSTTKSVCRHPPAPLTKSVAFV